MNKKCIFNTNLFSLLHPQHHWRYVGSGDEGLAGEVELYRCWCGARKILLEGETLLENDL